MVEVVCQKAVTLLWTCNRYMLSLLHLTSKDNKNSKLVLYQSSICVFLENTAVVRHGLETVFSEWT